MPKILFYYLDYGSRGGIERYIETTCLALKQHGQFEPVVVCTAGGGLHQALGETGIEIYPLQVWSAFKRPMLRVFDLATMAQLIRLLRKIKPSVVHVHIGYIENLLFKALGYPLVYTFHGYGTLYSLKATVSPIKRFVKKVLRALFSRMIVQVDALLFVSRAEQVRMIAEGYLPDSSSAGKVLYTGLPVEVLRNQARKTDKAAFLRSLGIPSAARCVSFVNRLDRNKNPLQFVMLAERLMAQMPDYPLYFLMAGSGPLEGMLQRRIRESPIAHRIIYLGHREDVVNVLASSDLVVFLPSMEGFGLGVLETMAVGTHCLAYKTGGIPEILNFPEADALLVPMGDVQGLVEQAAALLQLPDEARKKLSQTLQQRTSDFEVSRFMTQLEEIYRHVLT